MTKRLQDFTRHVHVRALDTEGRIVRTFPVREDDPRVEALGFAGAAELDAEAAGFEVIDFAEVSGEGVPDLVVREL